MKAVHAPNAIPREWRLPSGSAVTYHVTLFKEEDEGEPDLPTCDQCGASVGQCWALMHASQCDKCSESTFLHEHFSYQDPKREAGDKDVCIKSNNVKQQKLIYCYKNKQNIPRKS